MIVTLGISHQTAPIEAREQLAFKAEQVDAAMQQIMSLACVHEAVVVSTCNRTEIYAFVNAHVEHEYELKQWWQHFCGGEHLPQWFYYHQDSQAILHLYRVACGLDSLVIGEPQILGQLKKAYQFALKVGAAHKVLSKLFESTFTVAKTVRTQTAIGTNPLSVAYCAVILAKRIFAQLRDARVCLIGAGETVELLLQHLLSHDVRDITIVNRSVDKAAVLAHPHGLAIGALVDLPLVLEKSDIVISATNSPHYLISKDMIFASLAKSKHRPVFMVDLAVPRDIDPCCVEHENVYLYTVDDLKGIIDDNLQLRQNAAKSAERVVAIEVGAFLAWLQAQELLDTVADFRHFAMEVKHQSLLQAQRKLASGGDPQAVLHDFAHEFTQKLLHPPTMYLRDASFRQDYDKIALVRKIFEFDKANPHEKLYS